VELFSFAWNKANHPGEITELEAKELSKISICMVSLNCWNVIKPCLESLQSSQPLIDYEVIIVDNASSDGTPEQIDKHFPSYRLIKNKKNVGFTRATNQCVALSSGEYILWLNTDTILKPDSLHKLWQFLERNPKAGIAGPKVLNSDGTFQYQCRRGMPTPSAAMFYILRFHHWWPNNVKIGRYLLTYMSTDSPAQVDAISGCCLMAKHRVWEDIGPLDENIFGFGEDIDWCVRARKAGWEVWYYPESVIVHLKGLGGGHSKPYHKIWGIHQAMWVFYRKHLLHQYPFFIAWLVWIGVWSSFIFSTIRILFKKAIHSPTP
jgi:GT2 family glycosyltransferase